MILPGLCALRERRQLLTTMKSTEFERSESERRAESSRALQVKDIRVSLKMERG